MTLQEFLPYLPLSFDYSWYKKLKFYQTFCASSETVSRWRFSGGQEVRLCHQFWSTPPRPYFIMQTSVLIDICVICQPTAPQVCISLVTPTSVKSDARIHCVKCPRVTQTLTRTIVNRFQKATDINRGNEASLQIWSNEWVV